MHNSIEKLAYKFSEAVQGNALNSPTDKVNIFHRKVIARQSGDIAYSNGLLASGLRSSSIISGANCSVNYHSIQTALQQHLPLVVNLSGFSADFKAFDSLNCFQFVAMSPQEHVHLFLLAQKVAELSLTPGFVIANYKETDQKVEIPSDDLIKKFLGSPDDHIEPPTPAQKIVFGPARRRIPSWFSLDLPVMLGAGKEGLDGNFEAMANEQYFAEHLQQIISSSLIDLNRVLKTTIELVSVKGKKREMALISYESIVSEVASSQEAKSTPLSISLKQLKPFPTEELKEVLRTTKTLTVLENVRMGMKSNFNTQIIQSLSNINIYTARITDSLTPANLVEIIAYMQEEKSPRDYFVGLKFTKNNSDYPKHEILLQETAKHYPELLNKTIGDLSFEKDPRTKPVDIPASVRNRNDKGPEYSKLARFYDNTGIFHQNNEVNELVADPFTSLSVTPAGTAGFFSSPVEREKFPYFRPGKCTGCGDCFVLCPHAALPPIIIGVEQLLRSGMELAGSKGHMLTKLTPMIKNLAKVSGKAIGENKIESLQDFLPAAFENLCKQMKLEGENLEAVQNEFSIVLTEIKTLPVAITDTFFNAFENIEKGSGSLFSLAVNPTTCTGCGICSAACPEEAINMVDEDKELSIPSFTNFNLWELFPSIADDTIEKLNDNKNYNSLASILLKKENYATMTGGSKDESFNAYKTLLHISTAVASSVVKPKISSLIEKINDLIENISENVHESLSNSLPKDNLDALAKTLKETRSSKASFHDIVDRITSFEQEKMVDTQLLRRKTDLVDALKELRWVLLEGPTGIGRAAYGLYLTGSKSMQWATSFPINNFEAPAIVQWQGSAPEQVTGLINGHLRHQIDNIKLIRRAELEAKGKYDPSSHDLEIAALDWNKLTPEERSLIPPILVVGDRQDINSAGWQGLNKLISTEYPVKVVLLDSIAAPSRDAVENLIQSYSGIITAITLKKAFVFQGSLANYDHLAKGLINGISDTKPALINLFAFDNTQHSMETMDWQPFADLATISRVFPAIYCNPDKEHGFLNGTINLEGNKDHRQDWQDEELILPNGETLNYKITWADWAYTQKDWESEFKKVSQDDNNLAISDYLSLTVKARTKKVPVIIRASKNGLVHFSVSQKVVKMTITVLDNWNTLQELAGLITEFPVKLSDEVKKEIQDKFNQDTEELKKEYEQKLKEQEKEFVEQMRAQIKERLITLSRMAKN